MKTKFVMYLFMAAMIAIGCNEAAKIDDIKDDNDVKGEFCSYLNTGDIDKTLPVVNEWLAGQSTEPILEALAAWLKTQPCVVDAEVVCSECGETASPTGEIIISFEDDGITKDFIFEISMANPLIVTGYREYEETVATFCSYLNVENIDKTLPFVDEWLAAQPKNLTVSQNLDALTAWLKSQPCIIDAAVYLEIDPPTNDIIISFDENGITKTFILELSMTQPLKAIDYCDYDLYYSHKSNPERLLGVWELVKFAYTPGGNVITDVAEISNGTLAIMYIPPERPQYGMYGYQWWFSGRNEYMYEFSFSGNMIELAVNHFFSRYPDFPLPPSPEEVELENAIKNAHNFVIKDDELIIFFAGIENKNVLILKKISNNLDDVFTAPLYVLSKNFSMAEAPVVEPFEFDERYGVRLYHGHPNLYVRFPRANPFWHTSTFSSALFAENLPVEYHIEFFPVIVTFRIVNRIDSESNYHPNAPIINILKISKQ